MTTLTRSFFALTILAALALSTGCGSSSGSTPVGVPITISLSANPLSINQGGSSNITATVTGDTTNAGVTWSASAPGCTSNSCLSKVTAFSATYNAPATLIGNAVASITATSRADTSVTNSVQIGITGMSITLSANPSTINAGQTSTITASGINVSSNVTWTQPGVGKLTNETATTATYNAPTSVTSTQQVTITATSAVNSSVVGTTTVTLCPAATGCNVAQIVVDGGPLANYVNGVFASATICQPGSSTDCVTVDHLLVDTGSFGLRVLQTALTAVSLTPITSSGQTLNNCVQFGDGSFLWGEVAPADVSISGEKASNIPIHLVADPPGGPTQIPTSCSNGGTDEDSQAGLLANGILGVGVEPTDCFYDGLDYCDGSTGSVAPVYYWCSSSYVCSDTTPTPDNQQVTNLVVAFAKDNNGTAITFPSVGSGQSTATGSLIFGIGTQSNNGLGAATVYTPTPTTTGLGWVFNTTVSGLGLYLPYSFIDSGSNAYFLQNPNGTLIPVCRDNSSFFCPANGSPINTSATNTGANSATGNVSFEIENADTLFTTGDFALGTLGGPYSTATDSCPSDNTDANCAFDWGLPFFYGRTVFTSIDGQSVPSGQPAAPWWAY
jgi:hypothetical protein